MVVSGFMLPRSLRRVFYGRMLAVAVAVGRLWLPAILSLDPKDTKTFWIQDQDLKTSDENPKIYENLLDPKDTKTF